MRRPRIALVVPRGEAVRNFLYTEFAALLRESADLYLLTVIRDERFDRLFARHFETIVTLEPQAESRWVLSLRDLVKDAHFRWLWSEVARNSWETADVRARARGRTMRRALRKLLVLLLANRPALAAATAVERQLSWSARPDDSLVRLWRDIRPDVVFNCSHIHGPLGELPVRVAHRLGIPTIGFVFSWDNLTSRRRILVPYDEFVVWTPGMRDQLLDQYRTIDPETVHVTGTPQFDFHFDRRYRLDREQLAARVGFDPQRPFILYTTGIERHFRDEHRTVEYLIARLAEGTIAPRPQLVVRRYVKGTSAELQALAENPPRDVYFPRVDWEERWFTPLPEDLPVYTSLLDQAAVGVNAASTVTLELMIHDTPVVNLGFDPPGSSLAHHDRWARHLEFDHFRPVVDSGATAVARSPMEMVDHIAAALARPGAESERRRQFLESMFGGRLDGRSAARIAAIVVERALARVKAEAS